MTERDFAILNKAACYAILALNVVCCAALVAIGSGLAFLAGVMAAIIGTVIAECLIVIPDTKPQE